MSTLDWVESSGNGSVHAVTTVRRKPEAGGDYSVSLVRLDEGVRIMRRVEGSGAVAIGDRVRARVQVNDGRGIVLLRRPPAASHAGAALRPVPGGAGVLRQRPAQRYVRTQGCGGQPPLPRSAAA